MFLGSSLPSFADQATDLLAKHKAFVGWQFGDGTIRTLRMRETLTRPKDGLAATTQIVRAGVAYRSTRKDEKKGVITDGGFTGKVYWATNRNGFIRPILGELQKYNVASDILFNEATTELSATSRGTKDIDGSTYEILRVKADASDSIDLYVDAQTEAYKRAVLDPDGDYEQTIDILSYGELGPGKKIISRWKFHDSQYTHECSDYRLNGDVTNDDLHPPKQTATWTFANNKPFPIKVTDKGIYVDAKVNGAPGHFILDTGEGGGILLTADFVTRAKVKHVDNSQAFGIGGVAKTTVDKVDKIEIGGNTLSNVIVESQNSNFEGDERPDGLIGFDLFAAAIVSLDLDKHEMSIADPASATIDKSSGINAVVDLSQQIPTIPAKLNGSIGVNAMLDSGNAGEVLFGSSMITKYHLRMLVDDSFQGYLQSHPIMGGIGGGLEIDQCGKLESVSFGPVVYDQAPGCQSSAFGEFGERNILLGFDFMKNFNYVFDYPDSTLLLIPRKM